MGSMAGSSYGLQQITLHHLSREWSSIPLRIIAKLRKLVYEVNSTILKNYVCKHDGNLMMMFSMMMKGIGI